MSTKDLRAFAERHRLRLRRGDDGDLRFPGRAGEICAFGDGRMAVLVLEGTVRRWRFRKREGLASGMEFIQDGDTEGTLLFDPSNEEQVRVAIRISGVRQKRRMAEKDRERLMNYGRQYQFRSDAFAAGTPARGQLATNADSDAAGHVGDKEGTGEAPCREKA